MGNFYSYAYDENGNLKSRTDALGRTTNYSYDPLGRPLSAAYPNGTRVDMTYDAVGNVLSATDETGTYSYAYDERDRLIKESLPGNQVLQHGYDSASNPTSLTYPDGVKALFEYDANNRLTAVTDRAGAKSTYAYNTGDLPTKVSYPSGAGDTYTYDALGRVTQAKATRTNTTGGTTTLASLTYAYDKNSNPTSITDKASNQSTFAYDALDRLTKEVHPAKTLAYTYDAAGNRKSLTSTTTTTNYTYNAAERMTKAGATTFTYNKNGAMTPKTAGTTTTNYTYDFEGALTKAGTKTYARDPFGRAVSSTVGTTKTDYLFDGSEAVQQKTGTTATTYYTRGLRGELINRRGGGNPLRYYHHDAIGSVVGLTDSTGALTDTYSYSAFGEVRARTGTNTQPYQYLENSYDSNSKLMDFHARAYDPAVGRFTSTDPVAGFAEAPQSLNPYSYAYNGPLAYPDPYGECPICAGALPLIGRAAVVAGRVVVVDAATNATISAGGYYLNHRAEKDEIDWADFRRTVGQQTLDQTLSDFENPLSFLPISKLERASEVLKFADEANDARRAGDSILRLGPYAGDSIPARGPQRNLNKAERDKVNASGRKEGCHRCGTAKPGTKSGNFILDHQPPNQLNPPGGTQRLYPHCASCSRPQGGHLSHYPKP